MTTTHSSGARASPVAIGTPSRRTPASLPPSSRRSFGHFSASVRPTRWFAEPRQLTRRQRQIRVAARDSAGSRRRERGLREGCRRRNPLPAKAPSASSLPPGDDPKRPRSPSATSRLPSSLVESTSSRESSRTPRARASHPSSKHPSAFKTAISRGCRRVHQRRRIDPEAQQKDRRNRQHCARREGGTVENRRRSSKYMTLTIRR